MLRNLSRKLSRREPKRADSPDFACHTARTVERDAGARTSFEADDEIQFSTDRYAGGQLEALALESIIAPTLVRQRPRMAPMEAMVQPSRRGSQASLVLAQPPHALVPMHMGPGQVRSDVVLLQQPIPGITITPTEDHGNPFDSLPPSPTPLAMSQRPRTGRPILRRNAISVRTQRDLPLRIQAVRRAHQEEFTRQLDERPPILADVPRQGGLRRAPPPPQDPTRLSPQSSVRRGRLTPPPLALEPMHEVDYYIEAAAEYWDLPESPRGTRWRDP